MPAMDTYSSSLFTKRRSLAGGDIMSYPSSRPAPAGKENMDAEPTRSASRSKDGTSHRPSRHHSRPRRHRTSRASHDSSSSNTYSSDSSKTHHTSRDKMPNHGVPCQDTQLLDFFKDTKIEMMRIVETDLQLKTDVRQIKETFYNLIKNFEAFEQRNPEYEIRETLEQQPTKSIYRRQKSREHQRKSRHARRYATELSSMRSSMASSVSQHCPNNTKVSPNGETWASTLGSNDTAELPESQYSKAMMASQSVISEQGVENISSITRYSNITYREQVSQSHIIDLPGPLSSTMSYPQYSTPEKQMRLSRIEDVNPTSRTSCTRKLDMDEPRPKPTGMDNIHVAKPSAHHQVLFNSQCTDSDATPVVAQRSRPVLDCIRSAGEDSSFGHDQATPVAKRHAIDYDSMDSRLRRQTAQSGLSDWHRSPVGLSETDLIDPSSFFEHTATDIQCSINATRASVPNLSSLSVSPSHTDDSGEGTPPSTSDFTVSTGVESSYKESDATNASSVSGHQGNAVQSRSVKRHHNRQPVSRRMASTAARRTLSQCTSATSTSSYGGVVAPTNSPNLNNSKPMLNMEIETIALGSRPPCIGSDGGRLPPLPSTLPARKSMSDPESFVSCMGSSRAARRAEQVSGASSAGSTCTSDKSLSSLDSSKGNSSKDSKGSVLDVPRTPKGSVRRSFSKKIMNLGKHFLRGSSKNKSTEEQHSV